MRGTGNRTVILSTEDGPRTPDSQLYLYVGRKDRSRHDPLRRNGLDNGKLYVLVSDDTRADENQILQGDTLHVHWAEIPNADQLTDVQTEAAADAAGAFGFVRIEDGAFRPNAEREFWFVTTGDQAARPETDPHTNELGRLYRLRFDGRDPLAGATLTQAYNADQLVFPQDGPLSPDNIDVTNRFVAINEDGTGAGAPGGTGSRDDMDARNRDGSIWIVPLATAGDPTTFKRVAELVGRTEGGRDDIPTGQSGIWETSGIVDAQRAFGRNTFLFDVQAHAPTTPPGGRAITVEDGQLLILRREAAPVPTPTPTPVPVTGAKLPVRLPLSTGATFYVAPDGSDGNPGTENAPWQTVQKALDTLEPGQTALVRAGTYTADLQTFRGGTPDAPITIRNYPGERPVLHAAGDAGDNITLQLGTGAAYIRLQGLTFEGASGPSTTNIYAADTAHDIEISDCEDRNSARQGFYSDSSTSHIQIVGCYFHDNGGGGPTGLDHQIYIEGSHHAIVNNLLVRAPNGNGIQVYPSSDHIVIAGNTIDWVFRDGIIIGSDGDTTTTDALVVNNVITNVRSAINTYWGGSVGPGAGNVARDNLAFGTSLADGTFNGPGVDYQDNLIADPLYADAGAGDYHLQPGSPALGRADLDYTNPIDLDGHPRPRGPGPDLGAYER
jgi:hypothetical protein